jgi:hypothetical protein
MRSTPLTRRSVAPLAEGGGRGCRSEGGARPNKGACSGMDSGGDTGALLPSANSEAGRGSRCGCAPRAACGGARLPPGCVGGGGGGCGSNSRRSQHDTLPGSVRGARLEPPTRRDRPPFAPSTRLLRAPPRQRHEPSALPWPLLLAPPAHAGCPSRGTASAATAGAGAPAGPLLSALPLLRELRTGEAAVACMSSGEEALGMLSRLGAESGVAEAARSERMDQDTSDCSLESSMLRLPHSLHRCSDSCAVPYVGVDTPLLATGVETLSSGGRHAARRNSVARGKGSRAGSQPCICRVCPLPTLSTASLLATAPCRLQPGGKCCCPMARSIASRLPNTLRPHSDSGFCSPPLAGATDMLSRASSFSARKAHCAGLRAKKQCRTWAHSRDVLSAAWSHACTDSAAALVGVLASQGRTPKARPPTKSFPSSCAARLAALAAG